MFVFSFLGWVLFVSICFPFFKGVLLHGPPGTGETLLAREISQALQARAPKIIAAPELLDRWVGGNEKLVRGLFIEAEAELAACGGDVGKSAYMLL